MQKSAEVVFVTLLRPAVFDIVSIVRREAVLNNGLPDVFVELAEQRSDFFILRVVAPFAQEVAEPSFDFRCFLEAAR